MLVQWKEKMRRCSAARVLMLHATSFLDEGRSGQHVVEAAEEKRVLYFLQGVTDHDQRGAGEDMSSVPTARPRRIEIAFRTPYVNDSEANTHHTMLVRGVFSILSRAMSVRNSVQRDGHGRCELLLFQPGSSRRRPSLSSAQATTYPCSKFYHFHRRRAIWVSNHFFPV